MNQHQIQRDMSKTAYWGTYQLEIADGHFVSNGNNRGSDASTNDARRVGDEHARSRREGARGSRRREGARGERRGSSTAISSILDGTGIIDHLLGAERLHFVLLQQKHFISNHRNNTQRSKVIPIFGCLSRHNMTSEQLKMYLLSRHTSSIFYDDIESSYTLRMCINDRDITHHHCYITICTIQEVHQG